MPHDLSTERLDAGVSPLDLATLATLHREAITDGFLATLGDRFLCEIYKTVCTSEHATVFVERREGQIVGFIAGSTSTRAVYREFVRMAGFSAAFAILPKLFSWRVLKRVVETALYPSKGASGVESEAEVLNFCVDADQRGRGVGQRLFAALVEDFNSRGLDRVRIVTGTDQKSAQRFYDSAGARLVGETQVHQGEDSLVYEYDLARDRSVAA